MCAPHDSLPQRNLRARTAWSSTGTNLGCCQCLSSLSSRPCALCRVHRLWQPVQALEIIGALCLHVPAGVREKEINVIVVRPAHGFPPPCAAYSGAFMYSVRCGILPLRFMRPTRSSASTRAAKAMLLAFPNVVLFGEPVCSCFSNCRKAKLPWSEVCGTRLRVCRAVPYRSSVCVRGAADPPILEMSDR